MPRRIVAAFFSVLSALMLVTLLPGEASAASSKPSKITAFSVKAGPRAGELTLTWKQAGKNTTGFRIETGLTTFSPSSSSSLPRKGRQARVFTADSKARSLTLSASQVAEAGAPARSGNQLYLRLGAVNKSVVRWYPKLKAVMPTVDGGDVATIADFPGRADLRVATFNVRTAKATKDKRSWNARRADVARQIIARHPDVVALQEIGPGRADGTSAAVKDSLRQTTSLIDSLKSQGASNYAMIRTTPYLKPGTPHGSQGTRILINTDAIKLASECADYDGKLWWNDDCSFDLPILSDDAKSNIRSAAYAKLVHRDTRQAFYVVSAHLDARHGAKDATYNALRGRQTETILSTMKKINTENLPMIMAGDWNSYQSLTAGNAPHDLLIDAGYTDAASARVRINMEYSTFNGFATTQKASGMGFGSRLDAILVKGGTPLSWENVTKKSDADRPSDHNMLFSTLVLDK